MSRTYVYQCFFHICGITGWSIYFLQRFPHYLSVMLHYLRQNLWLFFFYFYSNCYSICLLASVYSFCFRDPKIMSRFLILVATFIWIFSHILFPQYFFAIIVVSFKSLFFQAAALFILAYLQDKSIQAQRALCPEQGPYIFPTLVFIYLNFCISPLFNELLLISVQALQRKLRTNAFPPQFFSISQAHPQDKFSLLLSQTYFQYSLLFQLASYYQQC